MNVDLKEQKTDTNFLDLTQGYMDQLYSVAYSMTKDYHLSQDLVQETYLKAYKAFPNLKDYSNIRAWLFRILTNTYISFYRKKKVRPSEQQISEDFDPKASQKVEPEEAFDYNFNSDVVKDALDALPEANRLAVLMVDVEGFSYKETSEILDIPIGTVMSRLNRGRKALQDALFSYKQKIDAGMIS